MFQLLATLLVEMITKLNQIEKKGNKLMAKLTDVQNEIEVLKATVEAEKAEVKGLVDAAVTSFTAQIDELKAQIASGNAVTEVDLDGLVASVKEVEVAVSGVSDVVPVV